MQKKIIILLLITFSINTGLVFAQGRTKDSLALAEFFDSTNGYYWTNFTNWKTSPLEDWFGVFLQNNRVSTLQLPNNNLVGKMPESIGDIDSLGYLYLNQNQLTGPIPSSIGNLTNLISLRLCFNQLTGSIPTGIGNLPALLYLNLEYNQLSGSIPSSIENLKNLEDFHIFNNQLSGSIPSSIGGLTNLERLYLFNNQLTGSIPSEIGDLDSLTELRLFNNQLTGSIPPEIGSLSNLLILYLTSNQLTDSIPSEIGNLSKLRELYLENNQLTGPVHSSFSGLTNLTTLYLHNNELTDLPDLSSLNSLIDLKVQNNKLTFEDIEPNIGITEFSYSPQDSVGKSIDTTICTGSNLTISVSVGGKSNQYQWKKDGNVILDAVDSLYTIDSADLDDAGSYACEITNTVATELMLYSKPINVNVLPAPYITVIFPNGGEDWKVDSTYDITWTSKGTSCNWLKNPTNNHYYRLLEPLSWLEAETLAVEWGGHLVTLRSWKEESWIKAVFGENEYFWIGFNDIEEEGKWVWSSEELATYTNWAEGEPNNCGGEPGECSPEGAACMNWAWDGNGYGDYWNDLPTEGGLRGIIEATEMGSRDVHIEYSIDNGSSWLDVIATIPDTGAYSWTIPDTPSDSCLVRITDIDGASSDMSDAVFTISTSSSIPEDKLPKIYSMRAKRITADNHIELRYTIPEKANVKFSVYDITGKIVKIFSKEKQPGSYSSNINMSAKPTGIYFVRMEGNGKEFIKTSKVVMVR
jgi:hypothetical protein